MRESVFKGRDEVFAPPVAVALAPAPDARRWSAARDDALAGLAPHETAAWYRRLAEYVFVSQPESLAARMLLWWLDGGGNPLIFSARHVYHLPYVRAYLLRQVRPVLLGRRKAARPRGGRWGGVARRLGEEPAPPSERTYHLWYEGPPVKAPWLREVSVEIRAGLGLPQDVAAADHLDVTMALGAFGLHTDATLRVTRVGATYSYEVTFTSCKAYVFDRYDWDPNGQSTLPNPDYGVPGGVAPDKKQIKVYHAHALRVEAAGLAAPFYTRSEAWDVADDSICGPARIHIPRLQEKLCLVQRVPDLS